MSTTHQSPYLTGLDRNAANFQPLTPLTLLERAAQVYPDQLAIVHGALRRGAAVSAFQRDHGEGKAVITDREFAKAVKEPLSIAKVKPLVIDYDDPEFAGAGERIGSIECEAFLASGDPDFAWVMPADEWD